MSSLKYITTCRIKNELGVECGQEIIDTAIDVPIIGEPPTVKTARFMEALFKHLHKKHPHVAMLTQNIGMQLTSYLVLASFETHDPGLIGVKENLRAYLFRLTRKNVMTDDDLRGIIAHLGLGEQDGKPVLDALMELRDVSTESGRFAPQLPENSLTPA